MNQSPKDTRCKGSGLKLISLLGNSANQIQENQESLLASNSSDGKCLGALKIDLAAGLSDIRLKVEKEHKDFLDLVAQGKIFKMQLSQEFAYNMMRDFEDYRPTADAEDNLQSGYKYYKIRPDSDFNNAATPEDLAQGIGRLAIEELPRCEIVLDLKGDEGETTNHYKGKEVWGNFGYIEVNGVWVDPDSEKDLAHAFKGYPVLSPEKLQDARAKDARIMSPAEADKFYEFFNDYVSDDEGDPRDNRMSPEEFAKMVRGTASEGKGDTWARAIVAPQEKYTDRPRVPRKSRTQRGNDMLPPQIDRDTGSYYSGFGGDNSDTASLLISAAGYPNAFKDDGGWSDTTTLPVFNTKAAAKAITWDIPGLTDEQRERGLADMTLRGEAHFQHSQVMARNRDELKAEKMIAFSGLAGCMREHYFIKQWLHKNPSFANEETRRLVDSISLETPFRRIERTMISNDEPAPIRPLIHISDSIAKTVPICNQVMVWGATKAEIEVKIGEYYFLRERIMAASGMNNEFIDSLIPVSAPRTPRVNF
ncbi:hypothetical protein H4I96_04078 [Botrytis cinerea]